MCLFLLGLHIPECCFKVLPGLLELSHLFLNFQEVQSSSNQDIVVGPVSVEGLKGQGSNGQVHMQVNDKLCEGQVEVPVILTAVCVKA